MSKPNNRCNPNKVTRIRDHKRNSKPNRRPDIQGDWLISDLNAVIGNLAGGFANAMDDSRRDGSDETANILYDLIADLQKIKARCEEVIL